MLWLFDQSSPGRCYGCVLAWVFLRKFLETNIVITSEAGKCFPLILLIIDTGLDEYVELSVGDCRTAVR